MVKVSGQFSVISFQQDAARRLPHIGRASTSLIDWLCSIIRGRLTIGRWPILVVARPSRPHAGRMPALRLNGVTLNTSNLQHDEACAYAQSHSLRAPGCIELNENRSDMKFHGVLGDLELRCNLFIVEALRNQV
jgi:hypothetical protein